MKKILLVTTGVFTLSVNYVNADVTNAQESNLKLKPVSATKTAVESNTYIHAIESSIPVNASQRTVKFYLMEKGNSNIKYGIVSNGDMEKLIKNKSTKLLYSGNFDISKLKESNGISFDLIKPENESDNTGCYILNNVASIQESGTNLKFIYNYSKLENYYTVNLRVEKNRFLFSSNTDLTNKIYSIGDYLNNSDSSMEVMSDIPFFLSKDGAKLMSNINVNYEVTPINFIYAGNGIYKNILLNKQLNYECSKKTIILNNADRFKKEVPATKEFVKKVMSEKDFADELGIRNNSLILMTIE